MLKRLSLLIILLLIISLGWWAYTSRADVPAGEGSVIAADDSAESTVGFARATGPQPLPFPETHGPHPDYQTEWWYYTGNLDTDDGRHFGYQLTFFRRALVPPAERTSRESGWAADQVYFAHFALTDVGGRQYHAFERFARGAAELAGAEAAPYQVWLEDWSVSQTGEDSYRLRASQEGLSLDLELIDRKGPVLQGDQGYSQKGSDPGNASYYYSLTRLESQGSVQVGAETFAVEGLSWMDHEYSTSALAEGLIGWDWFALQLSDGSELMLYQFRRDDGTIDPFSSGTYIAADGSITLLSPEDFQIEVGDTWSSPRTEAVYPAAWTVTIPMLNLTLEIAPYLADQELDVTFAYWEGAVKIEGQRGEMRLQGMGYIELTGYAHSMEGEF